MRYWFLLVGIIIAGLCKGQTIRTDVLVAGGTESGTAAAIQAAHSGVKVLFIMESNMVSNISQNTDAAFNAGISENFMKLTLKVRTDTISGFVSPLSQAVASDVLKGWADTVKNLTIWRNVVWQKIEKSNKDWEVKLKDGRTIKASVIVDATDNGALAAKGGVLLDQATGYFKTVVPLSNINVQEPYNNHIYRTTVAIGRSASQIPFMVPLGSLIALGVDNFILAGRLPALRAAKQLEPATMASGQAAGATAAYCAFFKTTTKSLNARVIQGELLAYKSWLVPFADIGIADSNFIAIQHVGATGLIKGKVVNQQLLFQPDSLISGEELRLPMKEYYSRSQIWFADNKVDKFTLGNLLSLIKFTASRGEELNKEVEKGWKSSFKFKREYDINRLITRREFVVLAEAYLKPFNVLVDINGKLLN